MGIWGGKEERRWNALEEDSLSRTRGVWVMVLRAVVERETVEGRKALEALLRRARADMLWLCLSTCWESRKGPEE